MWVARIKMWHSGSASIELTKKFKVTLTAHYLNAFQEKGVTWINRVIVIDGEDREKALHVFLREEGKRMRVVELSGNQVAYSIRSRDQYHITVLGNKVFFVRPIFVSNGFEFWTVGSHDKKQIIDLASRINATGISTAEITSMKRENLHFQQQQATGGGLTQRQTAIFNLACKQGYYTYPRKINLNKLAHLAKVSKTALRACLRRAEAKLLQSAYDLYK